jgi:hypothetical protein
MNMDKHIADLLCDDVRELCALVNEQAHNGRLWFIAATVSEAYLQQELRRLHQEVERVAVWLDCR